MDVMPIAASSCARGRPLRKLTYTLYGDSRVFMPFTPINVGSWVEMIVMLADVMKAEIGM